MEIWSYESNCGFQFLVVKDKSVKIHNFITNTYQLNFWRGDLHFGRSFNRQPIWTNWWPQLFWSFRKNGRYGTSCYGLMGSLLKEYKICWSPVKKFNWYLQLVKSYGQNIFKIKCSLYFKRFLFMNLKLMATGRICCFWYRCPGDTQDFKKYFILTFETFLFSIYNYCML